MQAAMKFDSVPGQATVGQYQRILLGTIVTRGKELERLALRLAEASGEVREANATWLVEHLDGFKLLVIADAGREPSNRPVSVFGVNALAIKAAEEWLNGVLMGDEKTQLAAALFFELASTEVLQRPLRPSTKARGAARERSE
jgi:hypothetical protein